MKKHSGFTLIEILVVVTIIGMLAGIGAVSYSSFTKNARDARRKADLEQIRGAIELYRSTNGVYPLTTELVVGCTGTTTSLTDPVSVTDPATYMSKVPTDPYCSQGYGYGYSSDGTDYTLGAALETGTSTCTSAPSTGCGVTCTYCVGPYGER